MYRFIQWGPSPTPFDSPPTPPGPPTGTQAIVNNILVHVPTEAVTLATAMSPFVTVDGRSDFTIAWVVLIGAGLITGLVRYLNGATRAVWIATTIAFVLWMALIPDGALALTWPWVKANSRLFLALAAIVSAVIAVVAANPKKG